MSIDSVTMTSLNTAVLNGLYNTASSTPGGTMDNLAVASQVAQSQVVLARGSQSNAAAGSSASTSGGAVAPPWSTPPATNTATIDNVFREAMQPLVDLNDPTLNRANLSSDYKNMFALYKGLSRMQDIATFASSDPAADSYRPELNNAFQALSQQLSSYVGSLKLDKVTLIAGIQHDSEATAAAQQTTPLVFDGAVAAGDADAAVTGLTGTENFTVTATKSDGTSHSVLIDLSQMSGPPSLNNIASFINSTLKTDGSIGTTFSAVALDGGGYRLEMLPGYGETVSLSAGATGQQPAVYVTGTSGSGSYGTGFIAKYDDLSNPQSTQAFQQSIHTDIATTFTASDSGDLPASATGGGITTGAMAKDSQGNVYVVGSTAGNMDGQINQGSSDVFLRKYDSAGNIVYTQALGATNASGVAIAIDGNDNVIVAGSTTDKLTPMATGGGSDTFVTKFDANGQEIFTHQAGPGANDSGLGVAVDASGNIFVSGVTQGAVGADTTQTGNSDGFVTKLDANGTVQYNQQVGSGPGGTEKATAVTVDNAGNYYVLVNDNGTAKLRKYTDAAGSSPVYETNLGSVGQGDATGLARDGQGNIYVTGSSDGATLNGSVKAGYTGGTDAFVSQVNESTGAINYVSYIGGGNTSGKAIAVQGNDIYLTGSTDGQIANASQVGAQDGFLAKLDATTGQAVSAQQFGGVFATSGTGLVIDPTGTSVLSRLGLPNGTVPMPDGGSETVTQATTARDGQYFTLSVAGGKTTNITLSNTDSFGFLAFRINQALGQNGIASVTSDGHLQIKATNNAKVTIGSGAAGQDLLAPLGLQPETLYGGAPGSLAVTTSSYVPSTSATTAASKAGKDPSIFALGFVSNLDLLTKADSTQALDIINNAMLQIRKAYDFTVNGPPPDPSATPANQGTVPDYLSKQIAAYQSALNQLSASQPANSSAASLITLA